MTLPAVSGWLIDFRTARTIFHSGNNSQISHCVGLCASGTLQICHCEEAAFRNDPVLKPPFIGPPSTIIIPDEATMERAYGVSQGKPAKKLTAGNEAAIFLTAIALELGLGIISDHRSPVFSTVYDVGASYGIPVLSAIEYFQKA